MDFLLYLALIPALGMSAQWLAWRTNLPGILLLLAFGIVLGIFAKPDTVIATLIEGEATAVSEVLFPLVSLAVAVIMFEGGLSLKVSELKESGGAALRLCTIGAAITFFGVAFSTRWLAGADWTFSFLLGAILVVTGPTVIGPLLRQVRPSRRVANTLKWEGIVIDPIGAIMAVLVFDQLAKHEGNASFGSAAIMLAETSAIGVILGVVGGFVVATALRRFWVPDNLHGVAALSIGLLLFGISNHFAHESGLITVTVMGIWLINQKHLHIEHIVEFQENLRTLLLGCLFIVLGSRVDLTETSKILVPALMLLASMILVVRPLSVFVSLLGSPLNWREKAFVASLAPRGIVAAAVSSIFALELERGGGGTGDLAAEQLSSITFIIIVGTVAFYGLLARPVARLLKLADDRDDGVLIIGAESFVRDFALVLKQAKIPVHLVDTNFNKISQAKLAGLDASCVNMLNENAREELILSGIGRLMAMTPNDEVNSLILRECRGMFERAGLYQLTFNPEKLRSRRGMTRNLMGRPLFGETVTHTHLRETHALGATFKLTALSEEFDYQKFSSTYQDGFVLLGVVDENGHLELSTVNEDLIPVPGQSIVTLVTTMAVPESHASMEDRGKKGKHQKPPVLSTTDATGTIT